MGDAGEEEAGLRHALYYTGDAWIRGDALTLRGVALLLAVVAMAFFAGMLVEHLRLDAKREDMLRRYDQVLQQYRDQQMRSEKTRQR